MPTRRSKIKGINRYLSPKKSRCRNEKKYGDYAVYTDASLDIKLLMALMRKKDGAHLRELAYVPNWILYAQDGRTSPARVGLIISHIDSMSPVLTALHTLRSEIERCRHLKKRFLIANLGIYMQGYDSQDGHSNSIIIDVSRGVVEHFEPHGTERVLRFHRYIADTLRGERPHSTLSHSQR